MNILQIEKLPLSLEQREMLAKCKDEQELKAAAIAIIAECYELRFIEWGIDLEHIRHNQMDTRWRANVTLVPKEAK